MQMAGAKMDFTERTTAQKSYIEKKGQMVVAFNKQKIGSKVGSTGGGNNDAELLFSDDEKILSPL